MHARLTPSVKPMGSDGNLNGAAAKGSWTKRSASPGVGAKRPHSSGGSASRTPILLIAIVTLGCVLLTATLLRSVFLTRMAAEEHTASDFRDLLAKKTLSFDTCYGMANQRLSILYGVLAAVELGRTVVIPKLMVAAGDTLPGNVQPATTFIPYDVIYDQDAFVQALAAVGVDALRDSDLAGVVKTEVALSSLEDPLLDLHSKYGSISNLHITCPLFKLKRSSFRDSTLNIVQKALAGITPNKANKQQLNKFIRTLKGMSRTRAFNVLHLRMESDWVEHCNQLKKTKDVEDNCMGHTDDIDKILLAYNVPTDVPLLVSTMWDIVAEDHAEEVLSRIRSAGYTVVTSREFPDVYSNDDREWKALVDFELALAAQRFIGNSVSTFSALAILQRRAAGQWAAHYNLGSMPIEAHIPARLLPWVFAYNPASPENDYMVKVAVQSSKPFMSLLPVCLWSGETTAPIYQWLKDNGVVMLHHEPVWGDELWLMAEPHAAHNARRSPIYRSQMELLSDLSRVDVAIMPVLEQYAYVLLTSPYIVFTKEVSLHALSPMLPQVIAMHTALSDEVQVPVSDVLLLNLLEMRTWYEEFKQFILTSSHGAYFPGYGPGASGAYAQFFEPFIRLSKSTSDLAINTGSNYHLRAKIVNFDGPKMHDFLQYYKTGACDWGTACEQGLRKSLCPIVRHWQSFMNETEDQLGVSMMYACETLYAPHLYWPKFTTA